MGMYEQFQTDAEMEKSGVELDYGWGVITIARAGGANKRYSKVLEAKTKPYRRAIQTETMDADLAERLLKETYAETIIRNWEIRDENGKLKKGIESPDGGKPLTVNVENIVAAFTTLPDLFLDVQQQAGRVALYRREILETDAKN